MLPHFVERTPAADLNAVHMEGNDIQLVYTSPSMRTALSKKCILHDERHYETVLSMSLDNTRRHMYYTRSSVVNVAYHTYKAQLEKCKYMLPYIPVTKHIRIRQTPEFTVHISPAQCKRNNLRISETILKPQIKSHIKRRELHEASWLL